MTTKTRNVVIIIALVLVTFSLILSAFASLLPSEVTFSSGRLSVQRGTKRNASSGLLDASSSWELSGEGQDLS